MERVKSTEKTKRDLKIAEIIYYSIGGIVLTLGVIFSIFGLILLNPTQENFENTFLKKAETGFFEWMNIDSNFASAGIVLMLIAIVYFVIVFAIFTRKGDKVEKITNSKKSRQRQVTFVSKENNDVLEAETQEK